MKPVDSQPSHILPVGTELPHNYIIDKILGEGGFGITYSGILLPTDEKVAIKEYFPSGLAHREQAPERGSFVVPLYGTEDSFKKGRQHFLNEASILKEFQNLNSIVSVKDVIEANGTVYLVMEYIDGITLKQYVKENGALSFQELLPLMKPVIQSLIQVHKQGLIHRDISPENLMVGIDNQLHLIDFGAASIENGHDDKTITVILKSGYAPPEQYLSDGKQGAWTDIYALCATMYMTLTGFAPPESIRRIQKDEMPPLAEHADITSWQSAAIEKGMSLNAADRFQNMESLYQALIIPPIEIDSKRRSYQNALEENKTVMKSDTPTKKKSKTIYISIVIAFFFLSLLAAFSTWGKDAFPLWNTSQSEASATRETTDNSSEKALSADICTMIDTFGDTYVNAKEKLKKLDSSIEVQIEWVYDNTHPRNIVLAQSVKPGTDFTRGSINSILLTVSKGSKPDTHENTTSETDTKDTSSASSSDNNVTKQSNTAKQKSGNSTTETTTSKKSTTEKSNYDVTPIDDENELDSFTID